MSVRLIEGSRVEPLPFALRAYGAAGAALQVHRDEAAALELERDSSDEQSREPLAATGGCLRGFCWAILIEAVLGIWVLAIWQHCHPGG
jgi:hypothetical protein